MRNDDAPLIGLMSGTSMDAVDAVLVRFEAGRPRTLARHALPLPAELRSALLGLAAPG
ncbi:MAG TPA: anhydro-N-acetylmuramic acid kinase, partial [Plasticicumulans sp.]|nr:anhydro-N-acetylmuramic acid kinase [Plasticicumulans sp.]